MDKFVQHDKKSRCNLGFTHKTISTVNIFSSVTRDASVFHCHDTGKINTSNDHVLLKKIKQNKTKNKTKENKKKPLRTSILQAELYILGPRFVCLNKNIPNVVDLHEEMGPLLPGVQVCKCSAMIAKDGSSVPVTCIPSRWQFLG